MTHAVTKIAFILSPFCSGTFMNLYDSIFVIFVTIFALIGLLINSILLFLIYKHSPDNLTPYKIFLANTTLTQWFFSIFTLISQPRVLSNDYFAVIIYLGPVQFFGEWVSYMSYIAILHLSLNSFISLMLSMLYRYHSINQKPYSIQKSIIVCIIGYMAPFFIMISCSQLSTITDSEQNQKIIGKLVMNLEKYQMVVAAMWTEQWPLLILVTSVTIGLVPIYIVMYWCRFRIHQKLSLTHAIHSSSTKDNIKRLVRALTIQSIFPFFSVFPASIFWILAQIKIVNTGAYSYLIIPCLAFGCIIDPLITIQYVLPYRKWVLKKLPGTRLDITLSNIDYRSEFQTLRNQRKFFVVLPS